MFGFMMITLIFIAWRCTPRLYTKPEWFPDPAKQQAIAAEWDAFAVEWERLKREHRV